MLAYGSNLTVTRPNVRLKSILGLYLRLVARHLPIGVIHTVSTSSDELRSLHGDTSVSSQLDPSQLIQDHQAGIWRYLRVLGCQPNEADDLTQETFLAVLRKPFEYYNKAAAASYLRKVAYHRFVSARRRSGKEVVTAELEMIDESWSEWSSSRNDGSEVLDSLASCFEQLTKRAKWALEMRFKVRLTRSEIAQNLEITEHGAKNLMQRAKQKLRECLDAKLSNE